MSRNALKIESNAIRPKGMNSAINPLLLEPGYVAAAYNADIDSDMYVTRKGYIPNLGTAWDLKKVLQLAEYKDKIGAVYDIAFGLDETAGSGVLGYKAGGTIFPLVSGLSGTARPYFIQLGQQLLFVNGVDAPFLLDGLNQKQFGITPPASLTATSSATPGDKVPGQLYTFAITYYNSESKAESSPILAQVELGVSDTSVDLTFPAANPLTADRIVIYSTVANGSILLFEDEIVGASTSYNAGLADTSLTTPQGELDNSRIEDFTNTVNYPALVANRLFLKTGINEIRHSKIGQTGPMLESFEASAFINTEDKFGTANDIVAIGHAGDIPIVGKQRSIGRLDPVGVSSSLLSTDTVRYIYTEISQNIPVAGHGGGQQVYGEFLFLAKTNIFATDGKTVRPVADAIKDVINRAGFSEQQCARISSINDETNKRVLFSLFASPLSTYPDYVLVGDYNMYPDFHWTIYRPGDVKADLPGLRIGSFYSKQTNTGGFRYFFGSGDAQGQVYEMFKGINDNGKPIFYQIKSKIYGDGATDKLYKTCNIQASGRGNDYSLQVCGYYDLSSQIEDCQQISLVTSQDTWDNALWDVALWGDITQQLLEYEPHRKARYIQLSFTNTGLDEPVSLFGWDVTGSQIAPF